MTLIINSAFSSSIVPEVWRTTLITPVFKNPTIQKDSNQFPSPVSSATSAKSWLSGRETGRPCGLDFSKACFTGCPIMGSPVEQTHWSRASWEINKLSVSCWWYDYEVELCPMGLRGVLRQCSWPRIVCPIHQWPATTAYLQTEIVWRWPHLSVPHLHSWRSSNTPKWSKQFLYG